MTNDDRRQTKINDNEAHDTCGQLNTDKTARATRQGFYPQQPK